MATSNQPTCATCAEALVLLIQPSDDEDDDAAMAGSSDTGTYVDDDVHLQCGCHFHWQCLLDSYTLSTCPSCSQHLITSPPNTTTTSSSSTTNAAAPATPEQQILCTLRNEGGLQHGLDILPLLTQEAYLKTFPEERRAHAFLALCAEGDIDAIVALLRRSPPSSSCSSPSAADNDSDNDMDAQPRVDILRYQDPTHASSGLHIAITNQRHGVAWLLLLLASSLDAAEFPADVVGPAEAMGLEREDQRGKVDVRALRDGEGKTAEERAREGGAGWEEWVRRGWLRPPEG